MRVCHTIVAFNAVAADFTHRVGAYLDQGFFADDMADSTIQIILGRQRELKRFFSFNPVVRIMFSSCPRSHIVFQAYAADRSGPPRPAEAAGGGAHELNGSHSNGQSIADEDAKVTANPVAVDFLRRRQGAPAGFRHKEASQRLQQRDAAMGIVPDGLPLPTSVRPTLAH